MCGAEETREMALADTELLELWGDSGSCNPRGEVRREWGIVSTFSLSLLPGSCSCLPLVSSTGGQRAGEQPTAGGG